MGNLLTQNEIQTGNLMLKTEWDELLEMREKINENGLLMFSSEYLERYSELLSKSLHGKGDTIPRSNNALV